MEFPMAMVLAGLPMLALTLVLPAAALADYPVAGTAPYQRPEGAPRIETLDRGEDWYSQALTGVSSPYPASLRFLENQGNWYTPFNRPGMNGRYDIRGWHADD